jgi:hypothetical protein
MNLLKEMKEHEVELPTTKPTVYCKLFEDNAGAIHIAKSPKMRPPHSSYQPEIPSFPRVGQVWID